MMNKALVVFAAISVTVFASSFIFRTDKSFLPQTEKCLIEYKNPVKIVLQHKEDTLYITRSSDEWFLEENSITTLADKKRVENLMNLLLNSINMYEISDSTEDILTLNLSDKNKTSYILTVQADTGETTTWYFGSKSTATNTIFLRNESSSQIYETQDIFTPYLTTDVDLWTCGELFAFAKNPVTNSHLARYRHGKISLQDLTNLKKINSVTMEDGEGRIVEAVFYSNEEDYFCTTVTQPSALDNEETRYFLEKSGKTLFEISSYTYNKITENK